MRELTRAGRARWGAFHARWGRWFPAAFFLGGFAFDIVTLSRPDDLFSLVQMALYLAVIAGLLALEVAAAQGWAFRVAHPGLARLVARVYPWRSAVAHFLLGSLLSVFTLFLMRSSSFAASLAFVAIMAVLLVANESERFQGLGARLRAALAALCLLCYVALLVPVLVGAVGFWVFLLSVAAASALLAGYAAALRRLLARAGLPTGAVRAQLEIPAAAVVAVFLALYFLQLMPPIPLAITRIGIHHGVERAPGGGYVLLTERPAWRFWERGDQTFRARPGDRVYCFAQIFAPTGFRDRVYARWELRTRAGWLTGDRIPVEILGGRDEGFRGYTYKANHEPGQWRVRMESDDGREIGRINLTIEPDPETGPRELRRESV